MSHEIRDNEVAIIIKPDIDEDGKWTGELKTGLLFGNSNHPIATRNAMDLALTMAASINVIEDFPDLYDYFEEARHELLKEMFPKQYAESELAVQNEMDYTTEGNVIKLTKWTKTMGEA